MNGGAINGLIFAVVMGIVGVICRLPALGYVIAPAMIINMIVAGLAGTAIPVILKNWALTPRLHQGVCDDCDRCRWVFAFLTLGGGFLCYDA